jgi:hypothetical protein
MGFIGLLVFIADIYGILMTVQSKASTDKKVLWVLLICILPVLGLLLWYLVGPGQKN